MSALYKQFKTDANLEQEGVVLDLGVNEDDQSRVGIRIARAGGGNVLFTKTVEQKLKPHRHALRTKTMGTKHLDRLMREVYADTVILDWENVRGPDNQPLPFNRDNVLKLLEDLPDLWKEIQSMSDDISVFREAERKEDAGN